MDFLQMRYEHNDQGYPRFYICGLAGDDKRDRRALRKYLRMFSAAPAMLDLLREVADYSGGADSVVEDNYVMDRIHEIITHCGNAEEQP